MQTGTLKLKIQILCGDEIAMGPGKADLLDAIALDALLRPIPLPAALS